MIAWLALAVALAALALFGLLAAAAVVGWRKARPAIEPLLAMLRPPAGKP